MKLNPTLIRSQIDYWFEQSKEVSSSWYEDTFLFCQELANQYEVPVRYVVAILSALSPQQKFEQNKKNTEYYFKTGYVKHTSRQRDKIELMKFILEEKNEKEQDKFLMKCLGGSKTKFFYHNIVYRDQSPFVTLDSWMIKVLVDWKRKHLTKNQYEIVSNIMIQKAYDYNIPVCNLQAKIWTCIRDGKNF